jgi:hypothetical protein
VGAPETTHVAKVTVKIAGGVDIGHVVDRMEWVSFVNGGYQVSIRAGDAEFAILKDLVTQQHLKKARKQPTPIEFQFHWHGLSKTTKRIAYLTSVRGRGSGSGSGCDLEFVGIDPPSWWLNAGYGEGKTFKGCVSDVIKKVCEEYFTSKEKGAKVEVSETKDSKENFWYMHRMDPKTFITSLLDWSSPVTPKRTHWIVASVDKKLIIKEQSDLKEHKKGPYTWNTKSPGANDIFAFELLTDTFVSVMQSRLVTQGMSTLSGEYYDKITAEKKTYVWDDNTEKKVNAKIAADQGYKRPEEKWATSIFAVPEHSAGEVGVEYDDYIDGRARDLFLDMLNMVMRMRFRTQGDVKFDDSSQLGKSVILVDWKDIDSEIYWLHGNWLVYGFRHIFLKGNWETDLYCARLDWDAKAAEKLVGAQES